MSKLRTIVILSSLALVAGLALSSRDEPELRSPELARQILTPEPPAPPKKLDLSGVKRDRKPEEGKFG